MTTPLAVIDSDINRAFLDNKREVASALMSLRNKLSPLLTPPEFSTEYYCMQWGIAKEALVQALADNKELAKDLEHYKELTLRSAEELVKADKREMLLTADNIQYRLLLADKKD